MSKLTKFEKFSISDSEKKKIQAGFAINWGAVCASYYSVVGMAQMAGDTATASAAWDAWIGLGCNFTT